MPTIGPNLHILMGIAGDPGSLDQQPFPFLTYGGGAWAGPDSVIVTTVSDSFTRIWHPKADSQGKALEPAWNPLRISNWTFGNGNAGKWLALAGYNGSTLLYGSLGEIVNAGQASIADDGTIAYKTHYWNGGITIVAPDGTSVVLPPDTPDRLAASSIQALPGGKAIWSGGAWGRSAPAPYYSDALGLKSVLINNEEFLLYWSNTAAALILQPNNADEGWILETQGLGFESDIVGGQIATIAWAKSPAEQPGDLVKFQLNRTAYIPLVDWRTDRPAPVWQTFRKPINIHITHPLTTCVFADPTGESGAIPIEHVGHYTEIPTDPPTFSTQERALFGFDSSTTPPVVNLRPWDCYLVECYRLKSETIDQSVIRWKQNAQHVLAAWAGDVGVIGMFYLQTAQDGSDLWTEVEAVEASSRLQDVVNLDKRIKLVAAFSYNRRNGIKFHPPLLAVLQQYIKTPVGFLTPIPKPQPVPPKPIPPIPLEESFMQLVSFNSAAGLIPVKRVQPSAQAGCSTLILPNDRVFSCQPDGSAGDRDPGTDDLWERAQVSGNVATYNSGGTYHSFGFVLVDKL